MTVFELGAGNRVLSNNIYERDDPRAEAWRDLLPRFTSAREAKELIENNRSFLQAADEIGRSDLTTLPEIRDAVRAEWDHVLHLSRLIHHDTPEYWVQK